jgi:hypothetical protein
MLPKESPLARKQLTHLRIYNAGEHPHAAQNPETIAFADLNAKNVLKSIFLCVMQNRTLSIMQPESGYPRKDARCI